MRRDAGSESTTPTTSQADWEARISGSGVVWYHDFSDADEVNQFRYVNGYGHDPDDVSRPGQTVWLAEDGITGGCMESRHSGTQNPPDWWRPMAPLFAGSNGRATDDPAANSSLTRFSWAPNPSGGDAAKTAFESRGHYGNAIYHGSEPSGTFNGTSYYIQLRTKISANRATAGIGSDEGGKLLYCTNTWNSATSQEIVINSYVEVGSFGEGRNLFSMYRSVSPPLADDHAVSGLRQIGGEYLGGVCRSSPTVDSTGCWFWPTDETSEGEGRYVTILKQVIPGTDSGGDTVVRVWKAEWGETSYTKIWDQDDVDLPYAAGHPFGHNAIICSGYQNQIDFTEEVWHRYAQIIFSHDFIACPQVYEEPVAPTLLSITAAELGPGDSSTVLNGSGLGSSAGQTAADTRQTIQWGNRFFYDHGRGIFIMAGKDASAGGGTGHRSTSIYTASSDSWATSGRFHIDGVETGHIYESPAYDPADGTLYINQWGTEHFERWTVGSPLDSGWTPTSSDPLGHWAQDAAPVNKAAAWHPNLFGAGDGGLVFPCNIDQSPTMQVRAWRKLTDTYHGFSSTEHDSTSDTNSGSCVYVASGDYAIVTFGFGNTYRIPAGSGGALGTPTLLSNPPIICSYTNSGARGMLFDDPAGVGGPYILEKCGTNRVWRFISNAWSLRGYTHPLPGGSATADASWYVASCSPLGVFVSYRRSGDPPLRIWEPDD